MRKMYAATPTAALLSLVFLCSPAQGHVYVRYIGLDTTHVVYDEQIAGAPYIRATLHVKHPDETTWEELAWTTVSGATAFTGSVRHANLVQRGTYSYEIRQYTDETYYVAAGPFTAVVSNTVGGVLLFDETVNPSLTPSGRVAVAGSVTVPPDLTLTLADGIYEGGPLLVSGTVARSAGVDTLGLTTYLYRQHTFAPLYNARCVFEPGSGGSVITGGTNLLLTSHSDLTVEGVSNCVMCVDASTGALAIDHSIIDLQQSDSIDEYALSFPPGSDIAIQNSTLIGGGYVYWQSLNDILTDGVLFITNGTVLIENTTIDYPRLAIDCGIGNGVQFRGCTIRGAVEVSGSAVVFDGCEMRRDMVLRTRTSATFDNNVFVDMVRFEGTTWYMQSAPTPNFTDNSFVGANALSYDPSTMPLLPIPIGRNYYGDSSGPVTNWHYLLRGGYIDRPQAFALAPHALNGRFARDTNTFPACWSAGLVAGQNTVQHAPLWTSTAPMLQGRDTLVSIEMCTDIEELRGAQMYLMANGQRVDPTTGANVVLRRDTSHLTENRHYGAQGTVNFVVPAMDTNSIICEVYLDTRGIGGYGTTGTLAMMGALPLVSSPPLRRQLHMTVVGLQLWVPGYPGDAPDRITFGRQMTDYMAAMLPIRKRDIHCYGPAYRYYGIVGSASLTIMLYNIALWMRTQMAFINSAAAIGGDVASDITVVVLADGALLGRGDGVNLAGPRAILFVEQKWPSAGVHELGHSVGLARAVEQYDAVPPEGMAATGITAFIPETGITLPGVAGDAGNRIRHMPFPDTHWYNGSRLMLAHDVMGMDYMNPWPLPQSIAAFHAYFQGLTAKAVVNAAAPPQSAPVTNGMRRIYVWGLVEVDTNYWTKSITLVKGTLRAMDVSSFSQYPDVSSGGPPPNPYALWGYNALGQQICCEYFTSGAETNASQYAYWHRSFDIPDTVARYEIKDGYNGDTVFEAQLAGGLTNAITAPAPGSVLERTVSVTWTGSATNMSTNAWSQPLQHLLLVSGDGETNWTPTGLFSEQTAFDMPTDEFAATNRIAFRVVTSDGIASVASDVGGLRVENRPPAMTIMSPVAGACGDTGTWWSFSGYAFDLEDGALTTGWWQSSLDGFLGMDTQVTNRILGVGTHDIRYIAADAEGCAATVMVSVTVGMTSANDLVVASNAFVLTVPGVPTMSTLPRTLRTGETHLAFLDVRNGGVAGAFALQLHVTPPSGGEALLASRSVSNVEAFSVEELTASFVPWEKGVYQFRGVVTNAMPPDSVSSNDIFAWTYTSIGPPCVAPWPDQIGFGNVSVGAMGIRSLVVSNIGEQALTFGTLVISGSQAAAFSITNDTCSGALLGSDQHRSAQIVFIPAAETFHTAHLLIPNNDPTRPLCAIPLEGTGVPEPGGWLVLVVAAAGWGVKRREGALGALVSCIYN